MFPSGCYQKALISAAGAENLNDRAYLTFSGLPPQHLTGRGRDFYAEYKTRFGTEPEGWAVYGYEAARVALKAIGRVGRRDRAAILAAIRETKDYEGALGTWSFDENGDSTLRTLTKIVVRDGAFEYLPPE
jgi:branched-chain amino acid transport system substrate-binding protein